MSHLTDREPHPLPVSGPWLGHLLFVLFLSPVLLCSAPDRHADNPDTSSQHLPSPGPILTPGYFLSLVPSFSPSTAVSYSSRSKFKKEGGRQEGRREGIRKSWISSIDFSFFSMFSVS